MLQRVRIAAVVATIYLAAACTTDTSPASPTALAPAAARPAFDAGAMPEAVPLSLTLVPSTIVGGSSGSSTGRVDVATAVGFDRFVHVTSDNAAVLPFLATGTVVSAGSTFAAVQLLPTVVSTPTVVTITVTGGGVAVSAALTVTPPGTPPPAPTLSSFTVSPGTVTAGTTATGTVTLPSAAPAGGVVVQLSSRLPTAATVPPSVTVPAGALRASFPITTLAGFPNSTSTALLTAWNGDTFISSAIGVVTPATPPSSPALGAPTLVSPAPDARFAPGRSITFDWSDVAGAASYTIQIDDRDTFPAPYLVSQTVTASRLSLATLPTKTMWVRVRATAADGTAGPWSAVRRFEVK